jgi:colanic acid/amylovoran biosynthesis glycosyltransferase
MDNLEQDGERVAIRSSGRLAVFTSQAPWAQSESFVLEEIAALRRHFARVIVVPVRPGRRLFHGAVAREVGEDAIRLGLMGPRVLVGGLRELLREPVKVTRTVWGILRGSRSSRILLRNLAVVPKALCVTGRLRRLEITHVHAHWASIPASMALIAARLCGLPWSFTAHRWDIDEDNLLALKVRTTSFTRAISRRGAEEILRILGETDWPTLLTLHMGTRIPDEPPIPAPGRQFCIACPANLVEKKGHRYLIEACRLLKARGHEFRCDVIGGGPLAGELARLVSASDLSDRVTLRGVVPHDQLMRVLDEGHVDVVVLPSIVTPDGEREGIPVALMEAMARRIPVVSTPTGAISELVGGGAGILVPPADSKALADAIEGLLKDTDRRAALAEVGLAKVRAEFDLARIAGQLAALIEQPGPHVARRRPHPVPGSGPLYGDRRHPAGLAHVQREVLAQKGPEASASERP